MIDDRLDRRAAGGADHDPHGRASAAGAFDPVGEGRLAALQDVDVGLRDGDERQVAAGQGGDVLAPRPRCRRLGAPPAARRGTPSAGKTAIATWRA